MYQSEKKKNKNGYHYQLLATRQSTLYNDPTCRIQPAFAFATSRAMPSSIFNSFIIFKSKSQNCYMIRLDADNTLLWCTLNSYHDSLNLLLCAYKNHSSLKYPQKSLSKTRISKSGKKLTRIVPLFFWVRVEMNKKDS